MNTLRSIRTVLVVLTITVALAMAAPAEDACKRTDGTDVLDFSCLREC